MQVTLDKQYPIAAGPDAAWQLLSNIRELASCLPGAQITEEIDAAHYRGNVRVKLGPALATFAGTLDVLAVDPSARTVRMMGKGADKGGSSASMELSATLLPAADGSILAGHAELIVNGKFAQFGGRMMSSVSDVMLAQFANNFSQKAQALQGAAAPTVPGADAAATVPAKPRDLNLLSLLWGLIRNFFAGLSGPRT
jgi:uncharacterized protein